MLFEWRSRTGPSSHSWLLAMKSRTLGSLNYRTLPSQKHFKSSFPARQVCAWACLATNELTLLTRCRFVSDSEWHNASEPVVVRAHRQPLPLRVYEWMNELAFLVHIVRIASVHVLLLSLRSLLMRNAVKYSSTVACGRSRAVAIHGLQCSHVCLLNASAYETR